VLVVANDLGVEALLEEVPDAVVTLVEALCVDAVEAVHSQRDVLERRLDDEVEVVVHQAVHVHGPTEARRGLLHEPQPPAAVGIVEDDRHPRDAANGEVVKALRGQHAAREARHERDRKPGTPPQRAGRAAFHRQVTGTVPTTLSV